MSWIEKLARQDWSAFQGGDLGCIVAVSRKSLWEALVNECSSAVEAYEREYLRRIYCPHVLDVPKGPEESGRRFLRFQIVERGTPDRLLFELRFDTALPAICYFAADPFETTGLITFVLDEFNDVRLGFRGALLSPAEVARLLLAPVLFKVTAYHPEVGEDLEGLARISAAYGESRLIGRRNASMDAVAPGDPSRSWRDGIRSELRQPWFPALNVSEPNWGNYALAAVSVLIATGLLFLVQSLTAIPIFWLLSGVIVFAFVQWGLGPGILALGLGIFTTDYFFVEPLYEISFNSTVRLFALTYTGTALLAYWLAKRYRPNLEY